MGCRARTCLSRFLPDPLLLRELWRLARAAALPGRYSVDNMIAERYLTNAYAWRARAEPPRVCDMREGKAKAYVPRRWRCAAVQGCPICFAVTVAHPAGLLMGPANAVPSGSASGSPDRRAPPNAGASSVDGCTPPRSSGHVWGSMHTAETTPKIDKPRGQGAIPCSMYCMRSVEKSEARPRRLQAPLRPAPQRPSRTIAQESAATPVGGAI